MDSGAVQALGVVLDDQLPVAGDVVNDPLAQAELLHAPGVELGGQDVELFGQRPGRFAEVQEDMAVPKPDGDGRERVVCDAKVWHIVHLGRGHELAGEVVGPGVVGAQRINPSKVPRAASRSLVPRSRQTLYNAWIGPSLARVTIKLS